MQNCIKEIKSEIVPPGCGSAPSSSERTLIGQAELSLDALLRVSRMDVANYWRRTGTQLGLTAAISVSRFSGNNQKAFSSKL